MNRDRSNDPLNTRDDQSRDPKRHSMAPDDRMITGLFDDRTTAERAYNNMLNRGYSDDEISLVMSEETRKSQFTDENDDADDTKIGNKALEGTGAGSAIGGAAGAAAG